ncbi:hypothetical protein NM09_03935 [Vibrio caribbeanicus]|uniref:Uncharacterized protein n=1 Tax=Vibrio caribbeanicus TaxID=701175 RepID=A0ACC4NZK1_9VIBR|nr:glycosyltransferase [Vibrio caribbeanicus]KHD25911.1 hypothetical protein NM09_03935 [Vibrio caribbeanicus]
MKKAVSFIIPIKHHENASNWSEAMEHLKSTLDSILSQTSSNWNCTIVVNAESEIPKLDERIKVCRVDYGPNDSYSQGEHSIEEFRDAVKLDKGRRVLSGLNQSEDSHFVMIVDDDDFLHFRLVEFLEKDTTSNGWYIKNGYVWESGGKLLFKTNSFNELCGTSLVMRRDFLDIVVEEDLCVDYIKSIYGSHKYQIEHFENLGLPLKPIPFFAAVYRVGHSNSHSAKKGKLLRYMLINKSLFLEPVSTLKKIFNIGFVNKSKCDTFKGLK